MCVPLALVLAATVYDLRRREVPDWIDLVLLAWAVVATACGWQGGGWWALTGGLALGFGLTVVPFALGVLGGGDVKLTTALGAALGPLPLLAVLAAAALAGGILALIAAARRKQELPYVPAIALGLALYLVWQIGVTHELALP